MNLMTKKRTDKNWSGTKKPSAKQRPSGKPTRPRRGKVLNVEIDPALRAALDNLCEKSRRDIKVEVSVALEEYLGKLGYWPPPPSSP